MEIYLNIEGESVEAYIVQGSIERHGMSRTAYAILPNGRLVKIKRLTDRDPWKFVELVTSPF